MRFQTGCSYELFSPSPYWLPSHAVDLFLVGGGRPQSERPLIEGSEWFVVWTQKSKHSTWSASEDRRQRINGRLGQSPVEVPGEASRSTSKEEIEIKSQWSIMYGISRRTGVLELVACWLRFWRGVASLDLTLRSKSIQITIALKCMEEEVDEWPYCGCVLPWNAWALRGLPPHGPDGSDFLFRRAASGNHF